MSIHLRQTPAQRERARVRRITNGIERVQIANGKQCEHNFCINVGGGYRCMACNEWMSIDAQRSYTKLDGYMVLP
jgi:hypothetical protein